MTQKVNPSTNRKTDPYQTSAAIALAGGDSSGWISPQSDPSELVLQDGDIDESLLNSFAELSDGTSLTVTLDPGEAFVYGAWVAKDTTTDVTLDASTAGQTIYLSWDNDATDSVVIGDDTVTSGNPRIPLYDFDTDGSGVTGVVDRRTIGQQRWDTVTVSSDYTAHSYENVLIDASSNPVTVTLPRPTTDMMCSVKAIDTANSITITGPESQNIDGTTNRTLSNQYTALTVTADGTNYFVF